MDDDSTDETDTTADDPPVPPVVREWAAGVLANDEYTQTFADAVVDVPARFDHGDETPTARWRFDGTLTVRVRAANDGSDPSA